MALNSVLLQAKMLASSDSSIAITQGIDGKVNFGLSLANFVSANNISITATNKAIALVGSTLTFNSNKIYSAADANAANGIPTLSATSLLASAQIPVDGITLVNDIATGTIRVATIRFKNTYSVTEVTNHIPTAINAAGTPVLLQDVEIGDQLIIANTTGGYLAGGIFTRKSISDGTLTNDFVKFTFEQSMDAMSQGSVNFYINATQHAAVTDLSSSGTTGSKVLSHDSAVLLKAVNVSAEFTGTGTAASAISLAEGGIAISKLVNTSNTSAPSNWVFAAGAITSGTVSVDRLPTASTTKGIVSVAADTGLTVASGALSLSLALAAVSYLVGDGKATASGLAVNVGSGLATGIEAEAGKLIVDTSVIATRSWVTEQVGASTSSVVAPVDFDSTDLVEGVLTVESPAIPQAIVKKTIDGEVITLSNLTPVFPDTITAPDEENLRTFTIDLSGLTITGNWQVLF